MPKPKQQGQPRPKPKKKGPLKKLADWYAAPFKSRKSVGTDEMKPSLQQLGAKKKVQPTGPAFHANAVLGHGVASTKPAQGAAKPKRVKAGHAIARKRRRTSANKR